MTASSPAARMFRLRSTPTVVFVAVACAVLGYVYRHHIVEPAVIGALCERDGPWWCPFRMQSIYFTQGFGLAIVSMLLAVLALLLPARWAYGAVFLAAAVGGFGLTLYNATGAGIAVVAMILRAAWLDRRGA